jgi:hypothetical protein
MLIALFTRKVCTVVAVSFGLGIAGSGSLHAQLDLNDYGTNYLENFNSISNGLPVSWAVAISATASSVGTATTLTTNGTSWGTTTGQFANYASTVSNFETNFLGGELSAVQAACTNRAVGVRQTGATGMDPGAAFVLQLLNTTNRYNFKLNLDFLTLSVQGRFTTWTVDYAVGANPSTFTPVGTIDDPHVYGKTNVSFSFGSALDNQADPVWIRVAALTAATGSNNRDTVAIDNFSLGWEGFAPIVAPLPIALDIVTVDGNAVLTWTNSLYVLQGSGDFTGGFTNILTATSPHTNLMQGDQMFFRLVHTKASNGN